MQISFDTAETAAPHVAFELGSPEIAGSYRPELKRERRGGETVWTRNGIAVPTPDLVRWVYCRFSDDRPDLEGEAARPETFRLAADASVRKWGGWFDLNHWSRPQRLPKELADAGHTPVEYVIGKLTEIRVDPRGTSWAEGYLWPASSHVPPAARSRMHEHADLAWSWLLHSPDMVHCSAGGPIVKHQRVKRGARWVTPIDIFLNHIAICLQGVHTSTEVRTRPFGAFAEAGEAAKALADGVSVASLPECPGGGFECYLRSLPVAESGKAVTAATVAGFVPEDLEGGKDFDPAHDCPHLVGGRFPSDHEAIEHLTGCLGWSPNKARRYIAAAREMEAPA